MGKELRNDAENQFVTTRMGDDKRSLWILIACGVWFSAICIFGIFADNGPPIISEAAAAISIVLSMLILWMLGEKFDDSFSPRTGYTDWPPIVTRPQVRLRSFDNRGVKRNSTHQK